MTSRSWSVPVPPYLVREDELVINSKEKLHSASQECLGCILRPDKSL